MPSNFVLSLRSILAKLRAFRSQVARLTASVMDSKSSTWATPTILLSIIHFTLNSYPPNLKQCMPSTLISTVTLSFWQHQIQDCHETILSCISSAQGLEPQDCYKLLEDMPRHHHVCAHPKAQRNFRKRDSKCLQLSQESTPCMPAKHSILLVWFQQRISLFSPLISNL